MNTDTFDLLDHYKIESLLNGFNKTTGLTASILDLEGNVLTKKGGNRFCAEFQKKDPAATRKPICKSELTNNTGEVEKYHFYKCLNGMIDVSVPIVIKGIHIANLYLEQFFFEAPDSSVFFNQVEKQGFDEKKYKAAFGDIPVISQEKVKIAIDFLLELIQLICEYSFQKQEQTELNKSIIESEEKFKAVFKSSNVGKSITLPTGEMMVNQAYCDMLGYNNEELQNKKWQDITPAEEIPRILEFINPLLKGEKDFTRFEKRYICKNGTHIWADLSTSILRDKDGKPLHFITTIIDITGRKRAESALKESEEKFRALYDNAPLSYQSLNENGSFNDVNPTWLSTLGYKKNEVIGQFFKDFLHPDYKLHFEKNYPEFKKRGYVHDIHFKIRHKEGHYLNVSFEGCIGYNPDGSFKQTYCVFQDITERKKAEDSNKELQTRFEFIGQHLPGVVYQFRLRPDGSFHFPYASQGISMIYGVKPEEVEHDASAAFKAIHPDDLEQVRASIYHSAQTLTPWHDMYRVNQAPGKIIWVEGNSTPLKLDDGSIIWHGFIQDITERKLLNESLSKSEERFNLAMRASNDGIFDWNLETNDIYYSPAWKKMIGYEDHELPDNFSVWESNTAPGDVMKSWELQQKLISKQIDRFVMEFKMKHKDGHWVDILSRAEAIFNEDGKAIRIVGTHTDITQRKQAEEAIFELKEFNESIVKNLAEGIILEKDDGIIQFANPAMLKMLGYEDGGLEGKHWTCFVPDDQVNVVKNANKRRVKGESDQYEIELVKKDGSRIVALVGGVPNIHKGVYTGLLAAFTDITELKQTEKELRESEERYRGLLTSLEAGVVVHSPDTSIVLCNNRASELLGLSIEQMKGKAAKDPHWKFISEDNKKLPLSDYPINRIINGKKAINNQILGVGNDCNDVKWLMVNGYPVIIEDTISEIVISFIDITESKKAKQALLTKMDELERFQKLTVGRELNMIELKKEVNSLLKKLGMEEKYKIVE